MKYLASISSILSNYPFLNIDFLGNTIAGYLVFILSFTFFFLALKILKLIALKKIKNIIEKISRETANLLILIIETTKPAFYYFLSFYLSVQILKTNPLFKKIINGIFIAWLAYQTVKIIQVLIDYFLEKYLNKEKDQGAKQAISTIGKILKAILWSLAILFVLANFGINITSIIAGLGIGGIAIALALQNILSDLFSSFAIYFDKPFVSGDFIIIGEQMGTVEKIGIKTTRLRALQGEEIVISNRELTSARIQNFKKMTKRRIVFNFGVTYQTSLEKLKKIPKIIEEIIKEEELAEIDRIHFSKFGDFSLDFEIVYYILSGNYKDYMNTQQNILFKIKEGFEKEKISMAFPTQTIHLEK